MARFFVDQSPAGGLITLSSGDARHLLKVLRARPGDKFTALHAGVAYTCVLQEGAVGRVVAEAPAAGEPPIHLTLFQGLAKGEKMESVIQHGTEVGVGVYVPVQTARSVVRLEDQKAVERVERWQRIAREAAEQCRRGSVPPVEPVTSWRSAASRAGAFDLAVVPWEEGGVPLRQALAQVPGARRIALYIGPEGGLTADEVTETTRHGAIAVTLGPRILRTETAGLAAASAILFAMGDLGA